MTRVSEGPGAAAREKAGSVGVQDRASSRRSAAADLRPVVEGFLGPDAPLRVTCWDGSAIGDPDSAVHIRFNSPTAVRRLMWAPNELGLSRAYVAGEIDVDGSIFDLLALRDRIAAPTEETSVRVKGSTRASMVGSAIRSRTLGFPPAPPLEEHRIRGRLHSPSRDRAAVTHHYDVGNDFYRLLLGPTLTYSCAYFPTRSTSLEEAQEAKYELICSKLGLMPGMRLLDVGCGFGGMVLHAARHHGVEAVGVTISAAQHARATERVAEAGLTDRIEIRLADYRDLSDGPFDAISSIGMFEHVGLRKMEDYFVRLRELLVSGGRLLNHAISRPATSAPIDPDSFMGRYVFPDSELHEVGSVVLAMQRFDFEVRDVESLREHYARTTRAWLANLEADWARAVSLIGKPRARIWRLYLAGCALAFEANRMSVHQVLAAKPDRAGRSGMPPTRGSFGYSVRN